MALRVCVSFQEEAIFVVTSPLTRFKRATVYARSA